MFGAFRRAWRRSRRWMPWDSRAAVAGPWHSGSWGWRPGRFPACDQTRWITVSRQTRSKSSSGRAESSKIARRKGLELPRPEVVDDEAMEHGSQIVSEPPFALVGSGQFAGQELGPELLKHLVGEMLIADLQVDVFVSRRRDTGQQVPPSTPGSCGPGVWALLIVVQIVEICVSRSSAIAAIRTSGGMVILADVPHLSIRTQPREPQRMHRFTWNTSHRFHVAERQSESLSLADESLDTNAHVAVEVEVKRVRRRSSRATRYRAEYARQDSNLRPTD